MERSTTREEFCQAVQQEAARLAEQVWDGVVTSGAGRVWVPKNWLST
jgi:hypothetical protein